MEDSLFQTLQQNFQDNGIEVLLFENNEELSADVVKRVQAGSKVGIGGSQTVRKLGLLEKLRGKSCTLFDRTAAKTQTGGNPAEIANQALYADWYFSSANAVATSGQIVNIDRTGNRIAAISYGPKNVYLIVGINKIVPTLDDALTRARSIAAALNGTRKNPSPDCTTILAQKLDMSPSELKQDIRTDYDNTMRSILHLPAYRPDCCTSCVAPKKLCYNTQIIEASRPGRITLAVLNRNIGY